MQNVPKIVLNMRFGINCGEYPRKNKKKICFKYLAQVPNGLVTQAHGGGWDPEGGCGGGGFVDLL